VKFRPLELWHKRSQSAANETNATILKWVTFYEGDWQKGQKHGKGAYIGFSGNKYEGEFKNDLRDGVGQWQMADGTLYKGLWKEDAFTGPTNEIYFYFVKPRYQALTPLLNGTVYVGKTQNGLMHGDGALSFPKPYSDGQQDNQTNLHLPKIIGKFEEGYFRGGANSKIILSDGSIAQVENFEDNWQLSNYKANAKFQIFKSDLASNKETDPILSSKREVRWDGTELQLLQPSGTPIEFIKHSLSYNTSKDSSNKTIFDFPRVEDLPLYELYEVLQCLKWIEFHVHFSKGFLEAELYTFQQADKSINEEIQKEAQQAKSRKLEL